MEKDNLEEKVGNFGLFLKGAKLGVFAPYLMTTTILDSKREKGTVLEGDIYLKKPMTSSKFGNIICLGGVTGIISLALLYNGLPTESFFGTLALTNTLNYFYEKYCVKDKKFDEFSAYLKERGGLFSHIKKNFKQYGKCS